MTIDHSSMHTDHRQMRREHANWLTHIMAMQRTHRQIQARVAQIEAIILEHDAELADQLAHIQQHELQIRWHEMEMADHERTGSDTDHDELADYHAQFLAQHTEATHIFERHQQQRNDFVNRIASLLSELQTLLPKTET